MAETGGDDDPRAVLQFDDGRWVCVTTNAAWRDLWRDAGFDLEGEAVGALLPDRFVAEGLGRLCDLAALTSTVRQAPVPAVAGVPRLAIATPQPSGPGAPAPRVGLVLVAGSPSTIEEMHQALETGSPELVAVFGPSLRVIDVNDEVLAVSGLSREEIIGRTNAEMGYPAAVAQLWDDHHRRVLETGRPRHVSYDLPTVLGLRRYESQIWPVVGPSGAVVAVTVRSKDLTGIRLGSTRRRLGADAHGPEALSARWERLQPRPNAPARARRTVTRWLREADLPQFADAAELAVSELVTNAAMHARTDIYLQVEHLREAVRVEVHDGSSMMPSVRPATILGGRGLALVDLVADRWGADPTPAGKVVWCEFEHGPPVRPSVPAPDVLIEHWAERTR